jgi:hypothetical protein
MKRQNSDDLSDQPVKKRKFISEDDLDLKSVKNANMSDVYSTNLVPYDIVCNHIVPHYSRTWLYVSKKCYQIAFEHLLSDSRLEKKFATRPWLPLYLACRKGYTQTVRILLTDPRVDPNDRRVWKEATNNYEIFKMFIACPRVSGMQLENYFIYAVELGCFDEVVFMLHDRRLNTDWRVSTAMEFAVICKHLNIVQYIMKEFKDKISMQLGSNALKIAAARGWYEFTDLLLEHGFDPTYEFNHALRLAVKNGHYEIVTRLLKCPEVDPTDAGELDTGCAQDYDDYLTPLGSAVEEAQKSGDERMIQILNNGSSENL